MVVRIVVPGAGASPPGPMVLLPDAIVIAAYLLIGYGFAGMLRRRRAADDDPARVDALLVGIAAAFCTWAFIIEPATLRHELSLLQVASSFFPVFDAVLLVLVAQLLLAGGARQFALWMLIVASASMFAG